MTIYILVLFLVLGVLWLYMHHRADSKRRVFFLKRPVTSLETWYLTYYGNSNLDFKIVSGVVKSVALILSVDPTQLLPQDSFNNEIALHGCCLLDDTDSSIEEALGDYFHMPAIDRRPDWNTLDDFIRGVIKHIESLREHAANFKDNL